MQLEKGGKKTATHHCVNSTLNNYGCKSIEDAGRVGDPTSFVRPCKTIGDGRSLVHASLNDRCAEGELHHQQCFVLLLIRCSTEVPLRGTSMCRCSPPSCEPRRGSCMVLLVNRLFEPFYLFEVVTWTSPHFSSCSGRTR